ncbi:glyoxalase/bleomycin resistance/extradiol dioxygenase family protein [Aggregatimonas sangjinii]|uniref:Glyoxalase/bleomycin resistance/extradiol dioxygenase family protein n=1 Tax=Aggregatimonas sangjinii TaxID=2583587 RepID=A0A5B7STU6_9FLAO|nr:VOC family protein [Aggregatimonas sangjinii]QCX02026.1 glyoxalase/bleomycin resistance/extradiol dioxygenase family protein [Aggregatimonas sangjinii]
MRIEHLAIWVYDLEGMREFYELYFGAKAGVKYVNPKKNFSSYFLEFAEGARLEIMQKPDIPVFGAPGTEKMGFVHLAISVGTKNKVDELTEKLRKNGMRILGESRTTGDGYYESVVLDPEGNRIELTV